MDDAEYQRKKSKKYRTAPYKTFFLSDGAEDKVSVLFGHIFEFCLRAVEKSFAGKSSRAYRNLRLIDIVAETFQIVFDAERDFDTHLLIWFKH